MPQVNSEPAPPVPGATSARELLIVGEPDCELGIKVLIDRPQDARADRLVGVIAGIKNTAGR